ncbi:hypothetical protein B0H10DRAFT_1997091 [Mycena sp. CBHHK59/15]|nr:hypothetical protein B0H10DRAFT_1997091 [Mycena sp. CBHHK59/15]
MSLPSLVGGIALRSYDFAPAIVFAAVYALLLPAFTYRLFVRRSRTAVLGGCIAFAVERVILFSLRAAVAFNPGTESPGLSEYFQATFAVGCAHLAHDVSGLVRCVLVNATKGPADPPSAASPCSSAGGDDPRRRFWFRRWHECMSVLFFAALATALVSTSVMFKNGDVALNRRNQALRHASAAIVLVLILSVASMVSWAWHNVPQIDRRALRFLLVVTSLLMIPPIYRLVVMHSTTADLTALDHQALNTRADKAAFYVFHILPEWTVVAMMCIFNVKDTLQTGMMGDARWRDETPKERAKRERKAIEKERMRAKKVNNKADSFEMSKESHSSSIVTLA